MHAIMTENADKTWLIEVVDSDPETDTEIVVQRLDTHCTTELTLRTVAYNVLADNGYRLADWIDSNDGLKAVVYRNAQTPQAAPPPAPTSEADEMLAISQTLALRALKAADDPKQSHAYMRNMAALEAHCEQLAHLMGIHKQYAARGAAVDTYPSPADALKYLRELAAKGG